MTTREMTEAIRSGALDERFLRIYGPEELEAQKDRYVRAIGSFADRFGEDRQISLYSVSGRSEISGNHTDHNHGCVIAGSISLDIIAVASPVRESVIRIKSEGFPEDCVDISGELKPDPAGFGTSASLIAGMCAGFTKKGFHIGGFDAYTTSSVLKGSGLSSSAAFEDMVGTMLNYLYNDGMVDVVEIAKLAQFAENSFFGKPSGLRRRRHRRDRFQGSVGTRHRKDPVRFFRGRI